MHSPADRTGPSIRTRLLATFALLLVVGLAATGASAYALQRANLERSAAEPLHREAREFATLALEGVDPETGQRFTTASALLRVAIQRRAFGAAEGALGLIGTEIEWRAPTGVTLRLEDDPALLAEVTRHAGAATTTQGRLTTPGHDYSYLVVPVRFAATGETGALVRATDLSLLRQQLNSTFRIYAAVAGLVLLAAGLIVWAAMGRLLAPIAQLRRAAASIGEDDLATRMPVRGHDDLTALTATMNTMLDRIEALVEGQRQLADDVGHELRTPLTIIKGNLELLDPDDPEEVRATRQLALEEASRMERLTEDLILLATSERADFVTPRPVDVAQLTHEVAELARGLGGGACELEQVAEVTADLDPQRIRQAWLQLVDNAVKYAPPGTPVGLGSAARGEAVWLWVRDHGPGVPAAEREAITARRVRGAQAIGSGRTGRGLGLAIVAKIVAAHAGRLDIADNPGGGSVFSIVLPAADPPPGDEEP